MAKKEKIKHSVSSEEEISLRDVFLKIKEWIAYLIGKWKIILAVAILGAILGFVIALLKPTTYTAELTFVTDQQNSSNYSGLSGLAAQFGFGTPSIGNDLFSGDNIFDFMKSRSMLEKALLTPVMDSGRQTLLVDMYVKMEELKEDRKTKNLFGDLNFDIDSSQFTVQHQAALKFICKKLLADNLEFNSEKSSIMSVTCESKNELFSKLFVQTLVNEVSDFYIQTKTKKQQENLALLQHQTDSVRKVLYNSMGNYARFQDLNQNMVRQGPQVQAQKTQIKTQTALAIYTELVKNLEMAKVALRKETPLIQIVDEPVLPLGKSHPNKIRWGIIGFLLAGILSAICLLFVRIFSEIMSDTEKVDKIEKEPYVSTSN